VNISEINGSIMYGKFTNDQLLSIIDAVRFAQSQLRSQVARSLRPGDTVQFRSNRNGSVYKGTLESIKIKNAIVQTALGKYRVPMNMLEAI
jgi:hypothetical protein